MERARGLEGRRSSRRSRSLPEKLPSLAQDTTHGRAGRPLGRANERLSQGREPAASGYRNCSRLLRAELSTRARWAFGRSRGTSDRLFRADSCGLALSQSRIPCPGLPPAARSGRRRPQGYLRCISEQRHTDWSSQREEQLVPYHDRGAIEAGALDGQKLEICWLNDPFDLLAIQIEGSGRVILEDGTPLRISYDSHNGYSYSSIERVLIERNLISRKEMSPQRVREWI